jgi:hypothetical protein
MEGPVDLTVVVSGKYFMGALIGVVFVSSEWWCA